jgi:hypothetical protein
MVLRDGAGDPLQRALRLLQRQKGEGQHDALDHVRNGLCGV